MKGRSMLKTIVGCATIAVAIGNAHAAYDVGYVWNWQNELSGNDLNGTRVWYYQYGNVTKTLGDRTSNLQTLDQFVNDGWGEVAWHINNSNRSVPCIGKVDWNMVIAPSAVLGDPGNADNHNVVLTWVSPVAGTLHIGGTVQDIQRSQDWQYDGISWWLDKVSQGTPSNLAGGDLEYKEYGSYGDDDSKKLVNLDVDVKAGDSISFIVNAGGSGLGDYTAYNVTYTLTAVPEVSSLASLAIGGGLLLAIKKRKHN